VKETVSNRVIRVAVTDFSKFDHLSTAGVVVSYSVICKHTPHTRTHISTCRPTSESSYALAMIIFTSWPGLILHVG